MNLKLLLLIVIVSLSSCYGVKIKGKKNPKKYYEEFFISQGIIQYFIKPLEFKGEKETFVADFTFRDSVQYNSLIAVNYSIFSDDVVKQVDSAFFITNNKKIKILNCEKLFIEKHKQYHLRNSCKITYNDLIQVINEDLEVLAYYNNLEHNFKATKQAKKGLFIAKTRIIEIIELNRD
ncbi:MAG: hypothetical protein JXL97_02750 [Bacteroidales bacterium]|nr:hypothetical protein [Bacteroidales bacterium]